MSEKDRGKIQEQKDKNEMVFTEIEWMQPTSLKNFSALKNHHK